MPTPLSHRASFLLSQLGHYVAQQFTERLATRDLEPAHFGVLSHLATADGRSQQELAQLLDVHRNAMVGLIDQLEQRGLVRRQPHPDDRRAHAIHLTPAAHRAIDAGEREADALEAEMLTHLDATERKTLVELLSRVSSDAGLPPGIHPGLQRRRRSGARMQGRAR
ncbi:MarR family winged helix-turn-helix transcriptional regulator [Nocardia callitridis]|uniref:HTH marR-type domain-containing protein n=1 Tax=Nocardia callitridis TaxID=648753 RepID=A0ABP9KB70_9NOCA